MGLKDILTMRFGNESLKKQIMYAGIAHVLYFQQAFSSPQKVAEMHERKKFKNRGLYA